MADAVPYVFGQVVIAEASTMTQYDALKKSWMAADPAQAAFNESAGLIVGKTTLRQAITLYGEKLAETCSMLEQSR